MEESIRQLRERVPAVRVMVGGAVLTKEYADAIGADYYGKDAMEAVRIAEEVERSLQ
jgi:5-methyltetrahydrofolate--homocysteine methyltransferase